MPSELVFHVFVNVPFAFSWKDLIQIQYAPLQKHYFVFVMYSLVNEVSVSYNFCEVLLWYKSSLKNTPFKWNAEVAKRQVLQRFSRMRYFTNDILLASFSEVACSLPFHFRCTI